MCGCVCVRGFNFVNQHVRSRLTNPKERGNVKKPLLVAKVNGVSVVAISFKRVSRTMHFIRTNDATDTKESR